MTLEALIKKRKESEITHRKTQDNCGANIISRFIEDLEALSISKEEDPLPEYEYDHIPGTTLVNKYVKQKDGTLKLLGTGNPATIFEEELKQFTPEQQSDKSTKIDIMEIKDLLYGIDDEYVKASPNIPEAILFLANTINTQQEQIDKLVQELKKYFTL